MKKDLAERDGLVEVGSITAAHGIRGEVRVFLHSGTPENLRKGMEVFLSVPGGPCEKRTVEKASMHGRVLLAGLGGVTDRNAAEALVGRKVLIDEADLAPLPEGTYYLRDLEGLDVFDHDTGEAAGKLVEVIQGPGQDIYRIRGLDGREALVPAVKEFIREVDLEKGIMRVHFIDGMF